MGDHDDIEELICRAHREIRRTAAIWVDTFIALNTKGIDPTSIEEEAALHGR